MSKHYNWLINCPADDVNFKSHLEQATEDDIKRAIEHLKTMSFTKTRVMACERELRRRERERQAEKI